MSVLCLHLVDCKLSGFSEWVGEYEAFQDGRFCYVSGHSHGGHSHAGGELADLSGGIVTNDDESTLMIHHHASSEANSAAKLPSPGVKESDVVVEMSSSKTVRTSEL